MKFLIATILASASILIYINEYTRSRFTYLIRASMVFGGAIIFFIDMEKINE